MFHPVSVASSLSTHGALHELCNEHGTSVEWDEQHTYMCSQPARCGLLCQPLDPAAHGQPVLRVFGCLHAMHSGFINVREHLHVDHHICCVWCLSFELQSALARRARPHLRMPKIS